MLTNRTYLEPCLLKKSKKYITTAEQLKNLQSPSCSIFFLSHQALDLGSIESHHWRIVTCSAMSGDNLLQGIDWLVADIGARIFTSD